MDEMCNVEDMVPAGCEECGEDAAMACGIDWEESSMDDEESSMEDEDQGMCENVSISYQICQTPSVHDIFM